MVNIISLPYSIESYTDPAQPPVPLSDCLQWCLQPDVADVFDTVGSKPTVQITIPSSCTVPADGTPFSIWGYDFTVESTSDFSSESFKVVTLGLSTALNLIDMFLANIFFQNAVVPTLAIVGSDFVVTLTWKECREQINFSGSNMDFTAFTAIGGSGIATNGVSPVFVDAYRLLTRAIRWTDATSNYTALAPFIGLDVEKLCDAAGITCLELNTDIGGDLFTMLPDLTNTSFIASIDNGRSMMRYYSLEYGWTYRDSCVAKSGTIMRSDKVLCLNAAFDIDDPYQIRRYWNNHPDGFPPDQSVVDYLTTQPKTINLCDDSFKWLWLLSNWQDDFGQYDILARWVAYKSDGSIEGIYTETVNDSTTMGWAPYQPICFNASPSHLFDILGASSADVQCYEIQCIGVNPADHGDVYFNATEYLKFCRGHCCDDYTDLYFLNPAGGIDTVVVRVDSIETLESDGNEIVINVPCGTDRIERAANGGRSLVATRVYQKVNLSIQGVANAEWDRWFKHLRQSPQRWLKITDEGGNPIAKKIVFETGSIKGKQSGFAEAVEFVGYFQDVPKQPGTEQSF